MKETLEFYQRILREFENDETINVKTVERSPGCDPGFNFVAQVHRITITGQQKDQDFIKTVIAKTLPEKEDYVRQMYSAVAMKNEFSAYNVIVPQLVLHAPEKHLPVTKALYASNTMIVLPDLRTEHSYTKPRESVGLDIEEARQVLENVAVLHAASFIMKNQDKAAFNKLTTETNDFSAESTTLQTAIQNTILAAIGVFKKRDLKDEKNVKAIAFLEKITNKNMLKELLKTPREHSVLNHGDLWFGNIFFTEKSVKLIDLQLMRYTSVAADLCYFFYINLKPADRREKFDYLVDAYLGALHSHLKSTEPSYILILTKEWLLKELKAFSIYGLCMALVFLPVMYYDQSKLDTGAGFDPQMHSDLESKMSEEHRARLVEQILYYIEDSA